MDDNVHEKRLTAVEVEISSIKDVLGSFKKDVDVKFDSLFGAINNLRTVTQESSKPQWQTYFGLVAIVLVIVGFVGNGYVRDQVRVEETVEKLTDAFVAHRTSEGHPHVLSQVENNTNGLSVLDVSLQREMRLLGSRQEVLIEGLDKRLQNEMRMLNDSQNVRIDRIEHSFTRVFNWQESHDKRVVGINAKQSTRINMLENKIFGSVVTKQ